MKIYKSLAAIAISAGLIQTAQSSPWPTATPDYVTVNTGQRVYVRVLANDIGDNLSLNEINERTVGLGTVQMNSHRKALYYKSARGFTGNDSFWYAIKDNQGRTNSTQVFVNVIPAPPINTARVESKTKTRARTNTKITSSNYSGWPTANIDTAETAMNTAITVAVLANDVGDRLQLSKVNDWTVNGGRAFIQDDEIVYTPKPNYVGEDSFWYNFTDARGRANSTQVMVTITGGKTRARVSNNGNVGAGIIANAVHIPMHVNFLKNQHFVWGEPEGTQSITVTQAAPAGSSQLKVAGGMTLMPNQLISYRATDGDYYTVATRQSQGNTIQLRTTLPADVAQGSDIWNFYHDGAHPNTIGYYSLADFALRNNNISDLNYGKHVMLGDSWFARSGIKDRLTEKLNNAQIINKGVGGNTAANMLKRFDSDVASQKPDVVWLIAGTNDYYQNVSVATYAANMKILIQKINAIGAKAMVFDSSVAPLMSGSTAMTETSHQYARELANLLRQ